MPEEKSSEQPTMTPEELTKLLESATYRFARTMPWIPHWYTLRKTWNDDSLFAAVVKAIRDLGEVRPWPEKKPKYHHTYFDANGWTYWSMGEPIHETTLINRTRINPAEAKERAAHELGYSS